MNSKKTKRALLSSVLALVLCFSMMLGTTFAWFTDEVTSSNNIIKSGILDATLEYKNDAGVYTDASSGAIFDYKFWEPGYTQIKNVKIGNAGNLAFRYQLRIVANAEVKDSEAVDLAKVIDVYLYDGETTANSFAEITSNSDWKKCGTLADLMSDINGTANGIMLPVKGSTNVTLSTEDAEIAKTGSAKYTIALHMQETAGNEYQDKSVGDGFSVQLLATQYTWENDSFDNTYDENAGFDAVPDPSVTKETAKTVTATWGIGGTETQLALNPVFSFKPTESYEEAQKNPYRYWHADFVVSADKDVDGSLALAGFYNAWCNPINKGRWVALTSGTETISAGTEIRLVQAMSNNSISVNYEELCNYGNDGTGFVCGASDLDGSNVGTTLTVELRLYETYSEEEALEKFGEKSTNYEKADYETDGKDYYITVGKYTHTFGAFEVANDEELKNALEAGVSEIALASDTTYRMPSNRTSATTATISGPESAVLDMSWGAYWDAATLNFEGITIKTSTGYVTSDGTNFGADYAALYSPNVTYTDCTFVGPMRVGRDGAKFVNCTFTELGNDYIWTYGNEVTFEGCTFNTDGKAILIYSDGNGDVPAVVVKDCTFNSTKGAKAGAIANQNCAAIEIHNYGCGVDLTTSGNTYDSNFSGEWRIKTYENKSENTVTVNGTAYTTIAIDGKNMTIDADKNVTVQ